MNMMEILEMLRQQSQQSPPLAPQANPYGMTPQSFDFASSPFPSAPQQGQGALPPRNRSDLAQAPAPAPAPAQQGPDMMGPHELVGPARDLAGPMGMGAFEQAGPPVSAEQLVDIEVPEREKKSHLIDKPFYKDNDRMAMMMAALSDGFGGMTLRGKNGMGALNKLTMANAQKNIKDNKTYDYLLQNNPEMAKVMTGIPPEHRGDFMKLYQKSLFADKLGDENSTADIRNFEFFNKLDPEQQKKFLGLKRGDRVVKGTDGSQKIIYADGSTAWVVTPEQAREGTVVSANAKGEGEDLGADFRALWKTARYAQDNINDYHKSYQRLLNSEDRGGIFQPFKQFRDEILADGFDDPDALKRATDEQLNKSDGIRRTMEWFISSGLGARGLDTPAEFVQWLTLNGGDLTMTNEATLQFLERAINNTERAANRYNSAITDDTYQNVRFPGARPYEVTNPLNAPQTPTQPQTQQAAVPSDGTTGVIAGQTYIVRNGKWETL